MSNLPITLDRLDDISGRYRVILCDVWGVVHNGVHVFADAIAALQRARQAGKIVVLVTNAPRPRREVEVQLRALGVPADAYDRLVTSGDATRDLIRSGPRRVFHLGAERDLSLFEGIDVELVEEPEASAVICTGFVDDE
ncbi:MAG: TIGR01459 family HAD-type hydrolase, partial [Nitratireductor sp.]